MPDDTFNDDTDQDDEEQPGTRAFVRKLERENREMKTQLAQMQRQTAFQAAGIDTSTPLGGLFAKAYEGDTSPAAVKAEWEKLNPTPGVPAQELAAHQQAAALSQEATTVVPTAGLPKFADPAFASEYQGKMAGARNQAEVLAIAAEYGSPVQLVQEG